MAETTVRQQYDQMAGFYDRRWQSYLTATLTFLKRWANVPPTATVLDIACGTGMFEHLILADAPYQSIVGIDLSPQMLAIARRRCQAYPHVCFQQASALALPFADGQFDAIVSASAFHYFDDPSAALAEMKRVIKPTGRIIVLDWCKDFLFCRICDFILQRNDPVHKQCYTQAQFHQLLAQAGLTVRRSARQRFGLVWGLMVATSTTESTSNLDP